MTGDERRTRLANERTFLAWWRTGLGSIGIGLAVGRGLALLEDDGARWAYVAVGLMFTLIGTVAPLMGWWRFRDVERDVGDGAPQGPGLSLAAGSLMLVVLGVLSSLLVLFA